MNVNAFIGFLFLFGLAALLLAGYMLDLKLGVAMTGVACMVMALLLASYYEDKKK